MIDAAKGVSDVEFAADETRFLASCSVSRNVEGYTALSASVRAEKCSLPFRKDIGSRCEVSDAICEFLCQSWVIILSPPMTVSVRGNGLLFRSPCTTMLSAVAMPSSCRWGELLRLSSFMGFDSIMFHLHVHLVEHGDYYSNLLQSLISLYLSKCKKYITFCF